MILVRKIDINPEDAYKVKVTRSHVKKSSIGEDMLVLFLKRDGDNSVIVEHVTPNTPDWRVTDLLASLEMEAEEGVDLAPGDFDGRTALVRLKVEIYRGRKQIKVRDWLPRPCENSKDATEGSAI